MPDGADTQSAGQSGALTLSRDGRSRAALNILAVAILVVGAAAFVCGLIVRAHMPATVLGIVAFVVGLWAQMNSRTREERIVIITGVIAAFVGMALGIGHGGFS